MADANLGRLLVRLGLDKSEFERGSAAVRQEASNLRRTLQFAFAGIGAGLITRELFQAARDVQQISSALRVATGSSEGASREFAFVRSEASRLGIELQSTAKQYAKLAASAHGTTLAGAATRDIFVGVAEASTALGLSADQTEGALRAIEQMISKGNVQAEELRGQLGERLPGAFQLAAKAMGVTTAELNDLLKEGNVLASDLLPRLAQELHKTFGAEAASAARLPIREIERFKNALFELEVAVAQGGFVEGLADGLNEVRDVLADPLIRQGLVDLGKGIGDVAAFSAQALRHVDILVGAFAALAGVKLAGLVVQVANLSRALFALALAHPVLAAIAVTLGVIAKLRFDEAKEDLALLGLSAEDAETKLAALREERDALVSRAKESGLRVDIDPSLAPGLLDIIENIGILEQRLESLRAGAVVAAEDARRAIEEAPFLAQLGFGPAAEVVVPTNPVIDETALKAAAKGAEKLADILQGVQDQIRSFEVDPLQLEFEQTLRDVDALHKSGAIGATQHGDAVRQLTADYAKLREIADAEAFEKSFADTLDETSRLSKAFGDDARRAAEEAAQASAEAWQKPFDNMWENVQRAGGDTFSELYRHGVSSFEDIADAAKDIFARLAGELTELLVIRPIIQGVTGQGGTGGILGALFGGGGSGGAGIVGQVLGLFGGGTGPTPGLPATATLDEVIAGLRSGVAAGAESGTSKGLSGLGRIFGGGGAGGGLGGLLQGAGVGVAVGVGVDSLLSALNESGILNTPEIANQIAAAVVGLSAGASALAVAGTVGAATAGTVGVTTAALSALAPTGYALIAAAAILGGISAATTLKGWTTKGEIPWEGETRWKTAAKGGFEGFGMGGIEGMAVGVILGATQFRKPSRERFDFQTGAAGEEGGLQTAFGTLHNLYTRRFPDITNSFLGTLKAFDDGIAKVLNQEEIAKVSAAIQGSGVQSLVARPKHLIEQLNGLLNSRIETVFSALEGPAAGRRFFAGKETLGPDVTAGLIESFFKERSIFHGNIRALSGEEIPQFEVALGQLGAVFNEAQLHAREMAFDMQKLVDALATGRLKLATDWVRDVQNEILRFTDPVSAALADHTIAAERRIANARIVFAEGALEAITAAERLNALERARIIEQAGQPLRDLLQQITGTTDSPLALPTVLANAETAFGEILARVQGGEFGAAGALTEAAQTLLDVSREAFGSTAAFFERFDFVVATLQNVLGSLPGFATGGSFTVGGAGGTDSQLVSMWLTPGELVTIQTAAQVAGNLYSLDAARSHRAGLPGFASGGSLTVSQSTPGAGFFRDERGLDHGLELLRETTRGNTIEERGLFQLQQTVARMADEIASLRDELRRGNRQQLEVAVKKGAA